MAAQSFVHSELRKSYGNKLVRYGGLRSFKVIETGTNQKPECDVLLVFHRNDHYSFIYFYLRQGALCGPVGLSVDPFRHNTGV